MDSEEKKSELRLKSKVIEVGFDSDDDEPIGSLFKLKRPRNAKKVKVGLKSGKGQKVEAEAEKLVDRDVDIAGMDDTLAIFRKKLKGPKKDIGSGTPKGRTLALSRPENGDGVSNVQLGPKKQEKSWDVTDNGTDATGRREARRKRKAKRPKIDSNMEDTGGQAVYDGLSSQDGTLEDQKQARLQEGSDHCSDQKQEDSLSAIFRRVQSSVIRKSRMNSSLGQNSKDLNLDEISNPSSEGDAGAAKSVRGYRSPSPTEAAWKKPKFDNDVNSDSELNNLNVALERCSKTVESVTQTSGSHGQELAFDLTSSNEVCDGDGSAHSQEAKSEIQALKDGLKFCSMAKGCILVSKEVLHPASSPRQIGEFHEFGDKVNRGSIVAPGQQSDSVSGVNTRSTDLEISSSLIEKEASAGCANEGLTDNPCKGTSKGICKLASEGVQLVSAKSTSQNSFEAVKSDEFDFDQCIDGSQKINSDCVDREPKFAAFSDKPERAIASDRKLSPKPEISSGLWESGTTLDKRSLDLNQNQPSDAFQETSNDEEANKLSTSMSPENAVSGPDSGDRDNKLSAVQRALRNAKKRRHGDMAYEGDADWEVLMSEQVFLDDDQVVDCDRSLRMPDRFDLPSSLLMECENGVVAAVSAGLKARAAGPIEKIKFKEVLKRKGGLQEYLRCRNKILSLWSKDVTRILPLAECGVTDTPSANEPLRASLIREIYTFLDQSGYINIGIASKKGKGDDGARNGYKLFKEEKLDRSSGVSIADSEDGVAFILGQVKSSETNLDTKNGVLDYENRVSRAHKGKGGLMTLEISDVKEHVLPTNNWQRNGRIDVNLPISLDVVAADSSCQADEIGSVPVIEGVDNCGFQYASYDDAQEETHLQCNSEVRKKIIVIGAGPAGLTAARHLQRQGFAVTILEARNRIGGRVYTDRSSLSVPVDLGASIITGVEADVDTERRPDPSSLVCAQLGLELTVLNSDCPLYDVSSGDKVPADLDEALEAEFNSLLDDMLLLVAQKGDYAMQMSLEAGLEYALKRRRMARLGRDFDDKELHTLDAYSKTSSNDSRVSDTNCCKDEVLSPLERRVMDWHFANLEYGCAALLKEVSLPFWNQDDVYGGFGGAHCMIKDGYSTVVESIGKGLLIHLNHVVTDISYSSKDTGMRDSQCNKVKVCTSNGKEFNGDAVLITVPLGCLKAESIRFSPPLPQWKHSAIQRLGFGVLNKVVLEFPEVFWDDSVDYFGATAEETDWRGRCFMFWNVRKTVGAPVLIALVVGKAAIDGQNMSSSDQVKHAVNVLRKIFGEASVPDPVASVVTDWGQDPFSYGAYSYVAIGASGEDYDILGKPVENCLFFAGEATCKEHPDTVGGAMMSGLREAVRVIDILTTGNDYTAEVEAMEAAQRQLESEGDEVRDITRRLEAVQLSNTLYKNSLDRALILTRESLLQDMFFNAKTTAGRLHLAKELLNLPVSTLKSFAGTKEGLTVLNSWILDSMGKDGTQLLRHCLRLLVRVSTDLHAVRVSGIGKTVKEKVCVHTSRDIRAIASQLVNVWLEVFRKEKASGGVKLARQLNVDSSKRKSLKDPASGKPPLRSNSGVLENKGSAGSHMLSNSNIKKGSGKSVKLDTVSHSLMGRLDDEVEQKSSAMSEEEQAAFAAAEAARAAAEAAARAAAEATAKAFASSGMQLPKIPSFHKFARREQYGHVDESDLRRKWFGAASGRQDCISEIDSRNCRVRDWPVDFSAACVNLDSSRMSADNLSQRSHSNEIASHMNFREHSGESAAGDSSLFTKAWVDTAGSVGIKDYHAIERWQSQAAAADSDFYQTAIHVGDEEDSNRSFRPHIWKNDGRANESSISQVTVNKEPPENRPRGADRIKQAVVDYVASLLMPLYKARKLDRDSYKSIMKKSATKVMEQATDAEKAMAVSEFLDFKRRNKIRAFVDRLIEKHMPVKPTAKS